MNKPLSIKDELCPFPTLLIHTDRGIKRQSSMINCSCIIDSHSIVLVVCRDYNLAMKIKEALEKL